MAVEATAAGARSDGRDASGGQPGAPAREIVPASPSPCRGGREPLRMSAPFIAQLAAGHLGDLSAGDRRVARRPETVGPRARAAYGGTPRLAAGLGRGFLVVREV